MCVTWYIVTDIKEFLTLKIDAFMYSETVVKQSIQRNIPEDMYLKLLKPTGHVMHQQFNIQQLYVLPTLFLCVLYLSENKQRLVPLTA